MLVTPLKSNTIIFLKIHIFMVLDLLSCIILLETFFAKGNQILDFFTECHNHTDILRIKIFVLEKKNNSDNHMLVESRSKKLTQVLTISSCGFNTNLHHYISKYLILFESFKYSFCLNYVVITR